MISRKEDTEELEGESVRGGIGKAFSRLLVSNQLEAKSSIVAVAENRLPPGTAWGPKKQKGTEEIFYIVSGNAVVLNNGEREALGPGDLVRCCEGEILAIKNDGEKDVIFLGIVLAQKSKSTFGFIGTGHTPYSRL